MPLSKRLAKEISDAQSLESCGIYYVHDEVNMRNGRAMIIGPEETPYAFCPLLFFIELAADHPLSSPKVTFMTSDGNTRFHPNLYVAGKVCLSILGTWSGPSWTAVMTISTVLTSIQSLLEPNPIVNEPGWEKYAVDNPKAKSYADYVQHALISHSLRSLLRFKKGDIPYEMSEFKDILTERGDELVGKMSEVIHAKAEEDEVVYKSIVYNMAATTIWKILKKIAEEYREIPNA